jgi:signal transduction histidine kinase
LRLGWQYQNLKQYILNTDNDLNDSEVVNFYDFLSIDEANKVKRNVHSLIETGEPQSGIIRIAQNDGSEKYLDYTFTKAIETEEPAFVGRISDITEIVNKERSLKQIIEKEKELNNSKSQFVRITSHELRTPLAIIQANAEILGMLCNKFQANEHDLNPEVMIGRITKEVKLMTEILNELMLISKIETGNIEFHPNVTDVADFIHDITHDMFLPYTDGRSLTIDIAQGITTAIFDKKLMRHALVNLINNAFKYSTGKPPPLLSISMSVDSIIFTIKDFGIGIPKEDQKKLFTSFFRASNVGSIHGTGLGLTVIDYAVKKHFGTISFKSDINTGTVFSASIPSTQRI